MDCKTQRLYSCIKDGGIAAEAAVTMAAKTQELALANQEEDPFADLHGDGETKEDEDELEQNETCSCVHDS